MFFFPNQESNFTFESKIVVKQMNYSCPSEDMRKGLHIQPEQGLIPLLVHLNAVFFVGPA